MECRDFYLACPKYSGCFSKIRPKVHTLLIQGDAVYNTSSEAAFLAEHYPKSPDISIDYAILEKATNVYTIPVDIGWSDLGTWVSLYEVSEKEESNNALSVKNLHFEETENCIIHLPKGKAAVIKGLKDYIVVDDGKLLLIYPKDSEQEIKPLSAKMVVAFGDEYL
jgi:mannose-1-phosphate guanylyltransferase